MLLHDIQSKKQVSKTHWGRVCGVTSMFSAGTYTRQDNFVKDSFHRAVPRFPSLDHIFLKFLPIRVNPE